MASSRKKPNSVADMFPDDLVFELLIRLPGKQIARCKCVCKSWRSIIRSAQFKDVYGTRQRGLILHWFQPVFNPDSGLDMYHSPMRLNIFHSPIRELKDPEQEDFSWLCELGTYCKNLNMTQIVNGLLCVDHGTSGLTIYNVCTGDKMRIPNPLPPYDKDGEARYHLGYDPASRKYKLLRWYEGCEFAVHIMTLRPSSSSSTWRKLDCGAYAFIGGLEMRTSTSDGFLCWNEFLSWNKSSYIILFDLNKEKFHEIKLPDEYADIDAAFMPRELGFARVQFVEHQQHLVVSLWSFNQTHFDHRGYMEVYVLEDDEGEKWSKHLLELPKEKTVFALANGTSTGEMVLMNIHPGNEVYCYSCDHTSKEVRRFQVGRLPERTFDFHAEFHQICDNYQAKLSCLSDGNNLYLSLDDILGDQI